MSGIVPNLETILKRVESWPEAAQNELAGLVAEMETGLSGVYRATHDELNAIDAADASGIATEAEVEAAFRTFRA